MTLLRTVTHVRPIFKNSFASKNEPDVCQCRLLLNQNQVIVPTKEFGLPKNVRTERPERTIRTYPSYTVYLRHQIT